jgi:pilus assembly protein CpaB
VEDVNAEVGDKVDVVVLAEDLEPYVALTEADVETIRVPERWRSEGALTEASAVAGMVSTTDLPSGTHLTEDLLEPAPALQPGQREIAILISAETGVAGKVEAGSQVDIVATFSDDGFPRSEIIVTNAQVMDVGDMQASTDEGGLQTGQVVPITFALSVEDALILTHAESFAQQVRLALIAPDDLEPVPSDERVYPLPSQSPATGDAAEGEDIFDSPPDPDDIGE